MKKSIVLGTIGSLAVAGSVGAFLLFNKSPKELYFEAELNNYKNIVENIKSDYKTELDYMKLLREKPYKNESEFKADINSPFLEMQSPEIVQLINSLSFEVFSMEDAKKEEVYVDLNVKHENKSIGRAEAFSSNKEVALKMPSLYDKYLVLKTDKFGEVMRKFNPDYEGPEKLKINNDIYDMVELDDKVIDEIKKDYAEYIFDSIDDENVSMEKIKYNGKTAQKLTLELSDKETKKLIKGFLTKLKDDKRTINLIVDTSYDYYMASMESGGIGMGHLLTEKEFKKGTRETLIDNIEDRIEELEEYSFGKGIRSSITLQNEEIVSRHFVFTLIEKELKSGGQIVLSHNIKGDKGTFKITANIVDEKGKVESEEGSISDTYSFKRSNKGFNSEHTFKLKGTDEEEIPEFVVTYNKMKNKNLINNEFSLVLKSDEEQNGVDDIKLSFDTELKFDKNQYDSSAEYSVSEKSFGKISLFLNSKTTFTKKLDFPDFNEKNSVDLSKASMDEIAEIMETVELNAHDFMQTNEDIFGFLLGETEDQYQDDYSSF